MCVCMSVKVNCVQINKCLQMSYGIPTIPTCTSISAACVAFGMPSASGCIPVAYHSVRPNLPSRLVIYIYSPPTATIYNSSASSTFGTAIVILFSFPFDWVLRRRTNTGSYVFLKFDWPPYFSFFLSGS